MKINCLRKLFLWVCSLIFFMLVRILWCRILVHPDISFVSFLFKKQQKLFSGRRTRDKWQGKLKYLGDTSVETYSSYSVPFKPKVHTELPNKTTKLKNHKTKNYLLKYKHLNTTKLTSNHWIVRDNITLHMWVNSKYSYSKVD